MAGFKQSFVQGLTERSTTEKDRLGDLRWEGNKCYKYVQYDSGSGAVAGVAGNVCYYLGGATPTGHLNNIVTSDLSDSIEIGAGVLQAALADNEYGWIQIKGPATVTTALTAGSDGDPLTPTGSTDGTLDLSAAALLDNICAYAEDISAKNIICDFPF